MCVVTVANPLGEAQPSVSIEEFMLGQGSANVASVGNPLAKNLSSFILREVKLMKIVTCAVYVLRLLARAPSLLNNVRFILEK